MLFQHFSRYHQLLNFAGSFADHIDELSLGDLQVCMIEDVLASERHTDVVKLNHVIARLRPAHD